MALFSCRTPPSPPPTHWRPPWSETRALTEDALILRALITRVSSSWRADGRTGHRKDVPAINQTPGGDSAQNRWIVLGFAGAGGIPWCQPVAPPFSLFGKRVKRMPYRPFFRPSPLPPPEPPGPSRAPRPLCFAPLPPPPSLRPGPRYELFPESVTGVIESALSSLSAKYWWMWSWMRFGF